MVTRVAKKPALPDILVKFLLMLLMSVSIVAPFVSALELRIGIFTLILYHTVFLGIWWAALLNKCTTIVSFSLILAAGIALAVLYITGYSKPDYDTPYTAPLRDAMDSFLFWARDYLLGRRSANPPYAAFMVAIFSAFVCLPVCIFTVKKFNAFIVALCGTACYTALTIIGHVINLPGLFAYILAAMLYFLLQNYMKQAPNLRRSASPGLPSYVASVLPLAAFVLALTILLSAVMEIDPAWMKGVRDKVLHKNNAVSQAVSEISGTIEFATTELGGDVILNDESMMEVDSPVAGLYLRCTSKDVYTGHSWEQSDTQQNIFYINSGFPDTNETINALQLLSDEPEILNELYASYDVRIKYTGMSTSFLYLPLKTATIKELTRFYMIGDDMLTLRDGNAPKDFAYRLTFMNLDYEKFDASGIKAMSHRNLYLVKYKEAEKALNDRVEQLKNEPHNTEPADEAFYTDDEKYIKFQADMTAYDLLRINQYHINNKFLQLPEELPVRVKALATDITQGADCDYDKALAIESYLSENYAYTLTPGNPDKGRDFVDQFLFETKRGYCTYYATAMAVLLRCEGIPSRFVDGYMLPGAKTNGVYNVTKREGHAWVEAYFEGLGWMTFDPTSPFTNRRYQTKGQEASATPSPTPEPSLSRTPAPTVSASATDKPAAANARKIDLTLPLLLTGFAALLALAYGVPAVASAGMRRMKPRDAALRLFGQYLRILTPQGVAMKDGETSAQFAERVDGLMGFEGGDFRKTADVFHLARYSTHEVTAEQKQLMLAFRKKLIRASRRKLGIFRYLFYRYVWAI